MTNVPAETADVGSAQEPLGTMLVRRELITPEQLETALAEQQASGDPLGKIVVALGFATPATIANALATQHGGLLKTEYGFATGFGSTEKPLGSVAAPPVSGGTPAAATDSLRAELAHASGESERLRDENERLVQLRAELEQRLATESQRAASLERELADRVPAGASDRELEEALAAERSRVAALEAAIEEFKETGEGWKAALAERDAAIVELVKARDEALAAVEAPSVEPEELDRIAAERDAALAKLATADAAQAEALVELERARDDALAQLRETKAELAVRDARIPELTAERDAALEEVRATKAELAELEATIAAQRGALDERDAAIAELAATQEAAVEVALDPWATAESHLLFFQGAEGYELVERSGPPPAAGERVEVPGGARVVARVSNSPAPGPRIPCAYLLAA
jgi:DNA repair exonuclease SbcCD ATPase subunit